MPQNKSQHTDAVEVCVQQGVAQQPASLAEVSCYASHLIAHQAATCKSLTPEQYQRLKQQEQQVLQEHKRRLQQQQQQQLQLQAKLQQTAQPVPPAQPPPPAVETPVPYNFAQQKTLSSNNLQPQSFDKVRALPHMLLPLCSHPAGTGAFTVRRLYSYVEIL